MKCTLVWPVCLETNVYIFFWYFITWFPRTTTNSKWRIFRIVLVDHKFKILVTGHFLLKNLKNKQLIFYSYYIKLIVIIMSSTFFCTSVWAIFCYGSEFSFSTFFYPIIFLLYQAHYDHDAQRVSLNIVLYGTSSWIGIFFFYWIFLWLLIFETFQSLSLAM